MPARNTLVQTDRRTDEHTTDDMMMPITDHMCSSTIGCTI